MPFSVGELANIANAALDFNLKGPALSQVIQERPLYSRLRAKQKTFPGGKGAITMPVKGAYTTTVAGYTHDDTVTYANPANIRRLSYNWREHHAGISVTHTELKHDGISVVDSARSESTTEHSQRELTALTNLLEDKLEDLNEGWARSFNSLLWGDGTVDAKAIAGVRALLTDTPNTGTTGGIDRAANTWWRHRAFVGVGTNATGAAINSATVELPEFIHKEMRQLRRYGGKPDLYLCGSDFLDAMVTQLRAKGDYTNMGWSNPKSTDIAIADINYNGKSFIYDPTLDDISRAKYMYAIDTRHLFLYTMEGEDMKSHTPARPADKYVMYRAVTYTGQLVANRMNVHGVYAIQ